MAAVAAVAAVVVVVVCAAEYLPEQRLLVTSAMDKTISFWDGRPGTCGCA